MEQRLRASRFAFLVLAVVAAALGGCNARAIPGLLTVMSTVMVPTDYPVQPGDTIYVLERFF